MDQASERAAASAALAAEQVFAGESEMAHLMRAMDWAQTPLGPVETWSLSLRMMVSFLLANRFPLLLWWGPHFCQLYNDPYRPVLGAKHPRSIGQPASECWAEIWDVIGPLIETPFYGGPPTWSEDIFLELNRYGFLEETHFTIAYSPVPDDTAPNRIGGVLATVHEITEQVVSERRVVALRDLGARSAEAKTAEEACQIAADALSHHAPDVPFALLYLIEPDGKQARLAAATGVAMGAAISPLMVDLAATPAEAEHDEQSVEGGRAWPFAEALRSESQQVVDQLASHFDTVPPGPWSDAPNTAVVVPIRSNLPHKPAALLVAGVSARLRFDDSYAGFFELVAGQIATAIANARAYEEERKRAEALAELDRAKTAFFSNVSHEFRTPLTLMLGPLEDVLGADEQAREGGQERLAPATREQLDLIHRNGLRLLKLVNTLLDFARIEAGRVRAVYEPTDLATYTAELASSFRSLIEKAGMTLTVACPPLAFPVYVDREMWEKIVLNLLSNAFKFTFAGDITVALRPCDEDRAVELLVRDTGVGIPAHEVPRLFERFHRIAGTRARTHEGSGIGLSLVQELVHLHSGTIEVESVEGAGTTVCVRVPAGAAHLPAERLRLDPEQALATLSSTALGAAPYVSEAARWLPDDSSDGNQALSTLLADAAAPRAAIGAPAAQDGAPARIVLADDNADMRDYLRRLLSERYAVEAVNTGAAALAAIHRQHPDLVLADVMMPELDGFGLLRALRDDPRTAALPVMLLSARAGEEATIEGLGAGADDYLVKPFSARDVLSRVAARLEMSRLRNEALARAQELETIFEAIADAVFMYDRQGRITRLNSAAYALLGLDARPEYARGTPQQRAELVYVRDEQGQPMPAEQSGLFRLLRGESLTGANAIDVRLRVADGRELDVNIGGAPLTDETGAIIGAIAVSRDVTERKRLERQAHETLEALLEVAHTLVAAPDAPGDTSRQQIGRRIAELVRGIFPAKYASIFTVAPGSETLDLLAAAGYSAEQEALMRERTVGQPLRARVVEPEQRRRVRSGEVVVLDLTQPQYHEQRELYGATCAVIAPMLIGNRFIGTLGFNPPEGATLTERELTLAQGLARMAALVIERDRLLREREEARGRVLALEAATERMDEFLGVASHELRTPLTSLMANLQVAERGLRALSDEERAQLPEEIDLKLRKMQVLLERNNRQMRRLDRLVGDLLDVARIQAGQLELRLEDCDLPTIVREVVREQRAAWPTHSITLEAPRHGAVPLVADADRVGQVVTNLLTNALKYSPASAPVHVRVRADSDTARVEVRDAGPGIAAEQQTHLFERFHRVPGIEHQSGSGIGLGLGLYICRSIVERHGGQVGVESAPGEGSTFWFTLPRPA